MNLWNKNEKKNHGCKYRAVLMAVILAVLMALTGCGAGDGGNGTNSGYGKENVRIETAGQETIEQAVAGPETAEPETGREETAEPETTEQETTEAETSRQVVAGTESSQQETTGAETVESESSQQETTEEAAAKQDIAESSPADQESISEDGWYSDKEQVALYLHTYKHLPDNYITKSKAQNLGWDSKAGNLWDVAPGMSIGGGKFGNREGILPDKKGRTYYECDIDYDGGHRGAKRIVYSNDGLVYYTEDHYESFELLYGEEE